MKKQLIVVVHGVGVREAGVSTAQVTACLHSGSGRSWRAQSSDDIHLPEYARYGRSGLFSTFHAQLRRFRLYRRDDPETIEAERVVTDFYWGDVSGTGQSLLLVISGYLRVVLGLAHAVRENARACWPTQGPGDRLRRRLASCAALAIHGPVVALNLVILAGLVLAWGAGLLLPQGLFGLTAEALAGWVLGFGALAAGYGTLSVARVYLVRHLADWVIWSGVLVLALCLMGVAGDADLPGWLGALDRQFAAASCTGSTLPQVCITDYRGIERLGLWLMTAMMLVWSLVILCTLALALLSRMRQATTAARNFVIPALSLMMLLWFLTMTAVWAAVMNLPGNLARNPEHVAGALRLVIPAALALLLIAAAGSYVHLRKGREMRALPPADYLKRRDTLAERHRLIVAPALLRVLRLFLAAVAALGFWGAIGADGPLVMSHQAVNWTIAGIGLGGVALTGFARGAFAMGIGILADVVVYLNDYSWKSAEIDPATGQPFGNHTRTPVERLLGLRRVAPDESVMPQGYWLRRRIGDRLDVLMQRLIRAERPDAICIISHSQGTVIALDLLAEQGAHWREAAGRPVPLVLVTMGSPYTHIYNTYFPASFAPAHLRRGLLPVAEGGNLTAWTNIFRTDDFVGTHIDTTRDAGMPDGGRGWPEERPVRPNGHTGYWVDRKVIPILRKAIEF